MYAMRRLGIPVVLGTDSAVSAGSLDIWEELRFALEEGVDDLLRFVAF